MTTQEAIVAALVAVSLAYILRSLAKSLRRSGCGSGCGKCATSSKETSTDGRLPLELVPKG
jgi:bacterioferritin-associated ferredoxin